MNTNTHILGSNQIDMAKLLSAVAAARTPEANEEADLKARLRKVGIVTTPYDELSKVIQEVANASAELLAHNISPVVGERREVGHLVSLAGASGSGKTFSLERLLGRNDVLNPRVDGRSVPTWRMVTLRSPLDRKSIGEQILRQIGMPLDPRHGMNEPQIYDAIYLHLKANGIALLVFDEIQHVVRELSPRKRKIVADTIKSFTNCDEWRTSVVASGLPKGLKLYHDHANSLQNARRHHLVTLPALEPSIHGPAFELALARYAEIADISLGHCQGPEFVARLFKGSLNTMGLAVRMTHEAILLTSRRDDDRTLRLGDYADVYRSITGARSAENPFKASSWERMRLPTIKDMMTKVRLALGEDD